MSAVVIKEIIPTEKNDLTESFVVGDQLPVDYYSNPKHKEAIISVTEKVKDLVYPPDETGMKEAATVVTNINVFVRKHTAFNAAAYKAETEESARRRSEIKELLDTLAECGKRIKSQSDEQRQAKLDLIHNLITESLAAVRSANNVRKEFQKSQDLSSMLKLNGSLTDGGKLTLKVNNFIKGFVDAELAEQQQYDRRMLIVENRCLKAEIVSTLTPSHFGTVFYAADELFNEKLEELVAIEINRKNELESRIIRQQEAKKQQEIQDALNAQQAEADRLAKEKAEEEISKQLATKQAEKPVVETSPEVTPESLRQRAHRLTESALRSDRSSDYREGMAQADNINKQADELEAKTKIYPNVLPEKRTVYIDVHFSLEGISNRVSNEAVVNHLKSLLEQAISNLMPENPEVSKKLLKSLVGYSANTGN